MTATVSWLDLTAADRDKVRRVLDLFSEQGTVDELGLGSLRDTISNALFPGTSGVPRYVCPSSGTVGLPNTVGTY